MVKKLLPILLALLLLPAIALADDQVIDKAGVFMSSEIWEMQEIIARIEEKHQVDMIVLTANDVPDDYSESMWKIRDYADTFYENGGYGMGPDFSGMLILLDMNNRAMWLSTGGMMIDYITDSREEDILDSAYQYLSWNGYGDGVIAALSRVEKLMDYGRREGSFRYDEATGQRLSGYYNVLTSDELILAGIAGGAAAIVLLLGVKGSYDLKGSTYSYDRAANSSIVMTRDEETFIRQFSTRTVRSTPSHGGSGGAGRSGGSGVHRSSSGRSHGGGGRRF